MLQDKIFFGGFSFGLRERKIEKGGGGGGSGLEKVNTI